MWLFDKLPFRKNLIPEDPITKTKNIYDNDWELIWDYEDEIIDNLEITTVYPLKRASNLPKKWELHNLDKILKFMLDENQIWMHKSFANINNRYFITYDITQYTCKLKEKWYIQNNGRNWKFMTYKITPEWKKYILNLLSSNHKKDVK